MVECIEIFWNRRHFFFMACSDVIHLYDHVETCSIMILFFIFIRPSCMRRISAIHVLCATVRDKLDKLWVRYTVARPYTRQCKHCNIHVRMESMRLMYVVAIPRNILGISPHHHSVRVSHAYEMFCAIARDSIRFWKLHCGAH